MKDRERSSFSGKVGFVLAAAGSAVGLGNIWRFPYLAAKYGGGIFLLVYALLAITFGFTLMVTEITIGRKTRLSVIGAYGSLSPKWNFLGRLAAVIPIIIVSYYCVIGGWVLKYASVFISGERKKSAADGYFDAFISQKGEPLLWMVLFIFCTAVIVSLGVDKGIEKASKFMMPVLIVLMIGICIYVLTLPGAGDGIRYYLKPNVSGFSIKTVLAALGQLFYSMSLAMGIMVTYGSYLKKEDHIEQSARQIELFDTAIAFLAGLLVIPAVFVYSGGNEEALSQGSGMMFITLPKVFADMKFGSIVGTVFFILVFFAALTSSISVTETVVSIFDDKLGWGRIKITWLISFGILFISVPCSLGFGVWKNITILGFTILDFFDFISNSILMPVVALLTCILIGFVIRPESIIKEVEINGKFSAAGFYRVMVTWIAPVCLTVILISSILEVTGVFKF